MLRLLADWVGLQRSQWMKKERLAQMQARKLQDMVRHAFRNVPMYNRLYKAAGVCASSITDTRSITRLPTITKQYLRDTPLAERTSLDADVNSCFRRTTSGSTGIPLAILEDQRSLTYYGALLLRRYWAHGMRPQHKVCIYPGADRRSFFTNTGGVLGFIMRRKVRRLALAADVHDHMSLLSKWKPDILMAPPSYFRTLIEATEKAGQRMALKVAIASGEMLDRSTRKLIGETFDAEVFDVYGLSEVGGVAWECPTHCGYHINADSLVVEFLRNGEPLSDGESSEMCFTNLYRKATPIIRYLSGDMAIPLEDECLCGRKLPSIKNIQGRVVDSIATIDGRHISPHTVMYTLEDIPGVAEYRVMQEADYSVTILVKMLGPDAERAVESLRVRCGQLFGEMQVEIKLVDRMPDQRDRKRRVVESNVKSSQVFSG